MAFLPGVPFPFYRSRGTARRGRLVARRERKRSRLRRAELYVARAHVARKIQSFDVQETEDVVGVVDVHVLAVPGERGGESKQVVRIIYDYRYRSPIGVSISGGSNG